MPNSRLDVFGWLADHNGCGHYRIKLPLTALRSLGWTAGFSNRLPADLPRALDIGKYSTEQIPRVVVAQRTCQPGPTRLFHQLADTGIRTVFEVDDDLLDVHPANEPAFTVYSDPTLRANLIDNMARAGIVTVSTPALAERMGQYNPNVLVLPNRIPDELLTVDRPHRDRLTIGWAGSTTHAVDFAAFGDQIRRFLTRNPKVDFHTIGGAYITRPAGQVRTTGWSTQLADYYRTVDFDIAVIPLAGHPFNRSKSPIKAMEMGALGIPVVASAFGPYQHYIRHGETGFLVERDHEWGRYLHELAADHGLRERMGKAARDQAATWVMSKGVHAWAAAYGLE